MAVAMLKTPLASVPEHGAMALVRAVERLATAADLNEIIEIVRTTARDISGADGVCFVLRDGDLCHYVEGHAIPAHRLHLGLVHAERPTGGDPRHLSGPAHPP